MRIPIVCAAAVLAGCFHNSIERQAQEVRKEAQALASQASELSPDVPDDAQVEQRIEVAEARQALVGELRQMAQVLERQQARATTPEALKAMFTLQQRYEALARRLETAGTDLEELAEIHERVDALDQDVMVFAGGLGT